MKTRRSSTRGFMCQPNTSTAVCVPGDLRSVVAPRRPDRTLVEHARAVEYLRYNRLVESSPRFEARRPVREDKLPQLATLQVLSASTERAVERRQLEMAVVPAAAAKTAPAQIAPAAAVRRERNRPGLPTLPSSHDHVFQGCAGKVKKHISKMEGVTSFSVDLESKRVTVMGHVSPAGVLESISKVKKAEFWPSTSTPVKTDGHDQQQGGQYKASYLCRAPPRSDLAS